jgi:hypothetical protein
LYLLSHDHLIGCFRNNSRDDRGVIVKIDMASFRLLTNRNTIVNVRLQDIGKKMGSKFASALDSQGNQISQDDVVRVISGPNRGICRVFGCYTNHLLNLIFV